MGTEEAEEVGSDARPWAEDAEADEERGEEGEEAEGGERNEAGDAALNHNKVLDRVVERSSGERDADGARRDVDPDTGAGGWRGGRGGREEDDVLDVGVEEGARRAGRRSGRRSERTMRRRGGRREADVKVGSRGGRG